MAKSPKQQTSDQHTVSAQPPAVQEAPRAARLVKRHAPDHPSVTPALRTLVDEVHGEEYAILSAGKVRAYIENKTRGFDILVATGEKA